MAKLGKFWQAEMLGIDMGALERERPEYVVERERPVVSWAEEFERLDYVRRVELARKARAVLLSNG